MARRLSVWLERLALQRREAFGWALYDWANSAFMLTVVTTVFPIYFVKLVGDAFSKDVAQQRFAEVTRDALIAIAVLAPLLGAIADVRAVKKRLLCVFVLLGAAATCGMFWLLPGDWELGLLLFGLANVGAAGSIVFYDALLPHVAREGEMDRLSTTGFALGYVGSGLLLAVNLLWIARPELFGLPHGDDLGVADATLPVRLSFLAVAAWWVLFTLPLLLWVKEPVPRVREEDRTRHPMIAAVRGLRRTFAELRTYSEACKMLLAFLIYNDGIATLIRMAAIYAVAQEIDDRVIVQSILLLQFVAVPFSIAFGALGSRFGAKRMIFLGVAVYCGISTLAYFMTENWHFVALAVLVGTVQGGTQGLSRSLFASLVPRHKSGEFFALFAIGEKFAGIFGPLVFALAIAVTGSARTAILSIIVFFGLGALVLARVDVEAGRRRAREVEKLVVPAEGA